MEHVRVAESLKYGLKLFGYLLTVVVVGGGGMALGVALAGPEVTDGVTDELQSPELLGGVILALLGLVVWGGGSLAVTYKLIADAVSRGSPAPETDEAAQPAPQREPKQVRREPSTVGPSPGEQVARETGPETTVPSASDVPDRPAGHQPSGSSSPPTASASNEGKTGRESTSSERPDSDTSQQEQASTTNNREQSESNPAAQAAAEPTQQQGVPSQESEELREQTAAEIAFGQSEDEDEIESAEAEPPEGETESTDVPAERGMSATDETPSPERTGSDSSTASESASTDNESERAGLIDEYASDNPSDGEQSIPPYEEVNQHITDESDDTEADSPERSGGFTESPKRVEDAESVSDDSASQRDSGTNSVENDEPSSGGERRAVDAPESTDSETGSGADVKDAADIIETSAAETDQQEDMNRNSDSEQSSEDDTSHSPESTREDEPADTPAEKTAEDVEPFGEGTLDDEDTDDEDTDEKPDDTADSSGDPLSDSF